MFTRKNKPFCPGLIIAVTALVIVGCSKGNLATSQPGTSLPKIKLPAGFKINIYAANVEGARSLALGGNGTIFVGSRMAGRVYALRDENNDGKAEKVYVIDNNLNMPNGVAWRDGALYVAEISRILRYDNIEASLDNPPSPVVVYSGYPTDQGHGWKFIAFGPDGLLYVPVGMPCNVCLQQNEIYGTITRIHPDGSGLEIYARGIRNSVGFDWNPQTGELWLTDNGRDNMGDDVPPDELNYAPRPGMNFGFPYCHGANIPDPQFGAGHSCSEFTAPAMELGPHVASLGMRFYTGNMFPQQYKNQIFIAEHGSWNRSTPIGYRITLVRLNGNQAVSYEVFAEGWLEGAQSWGRPVDLLVLPDGSMLVSDDQSGTIYRITYGE